MSTSSQSPAPEPAGTPNAPAGYVSILLGIIGVILLLPGLCSLAFLAGEIAQLAKDGTLALFRDGGMVALWILGLGISAVGIILIRAALKARRPQ
jgi:hypothetical protein